MFGLFKSTQDIKSLYEIHKQKLILLPNIFMLVVVCTFFLSFFSYFKVLGFSNVAGDDKMASVNQNLSVVQQKNNSNQQAWDIITFNQKELDKQNSQVKIEATNIFDITNTSDTLIVNNNTFFLDKNCKIIGNMECSIWKLNDLSKSVKLVSNLFSLMPDITQPTNSQVVLKFALNQNVKNNPNLDNLNFILVKESNNQVLEFDLYNLEINNKKFKKVRTFKPQEADYQANFDLYFR